MRRVDGLRRTIALPFAIGLLALATIPAAGALSVFVEAESFTDGFDMGGASIMSIGCTSASGGLAVDGLDIPGEWIEVKATLPDEACYELVMGYQAPYDEQIKTLVTVFDDAHLAVEADVDVPLLGEGLG